MTEQEMKERLYEAYKLEWLMGYGYSITDVLWGMGEHANDVDYIKTDNHDEPVLEADCIDIVAMYEDWDEGISYRRESIKENDEGIIYSCAQFYDYHIDYTAWQLDDIQEISEE